MPSWGEGSARVTRAGLASAGELAAKAERWLMLSVRRAGANSAYKLPA